jgi:transposase InsO family protein
VTSPTPDNITEAQVLVNLFKEEYNTQRPHRALDVMTPLAFAQNYELGVT